MRIFKDVITDSELFSDSFDIVEKGGCVYEVEGKMITKKDENDFDIGANASAEEATEDLEAGSRQVIDVVDAFGLFNTGPMVKEVDVTEKGKTKKEYTYFLDVLKPYVGRVTKVRIEKKAKYMKEILKVSDEEIEKVVATMEEENKAFKAAVAVYWKKQLRPNLKDFEWYRGSDDPEMQGMLIGLNFREDGITPYLMVWKVGVESHKV